MKKALFIMLLLGLMLKSNAQFSFVPITPVGEDVRMEDLWHLNLILNGVSDFKDYCITMDVYKQQTGLVLCCRTRVFNISNYGSTVYINSSNIRTMLDYSSVSYPNSTFYSTLINNNGFLPAGIYMIVYTLYGKSESPGNPGGLEKLLERSIEIEIGKKYPPHLIYPYDQDTIDTQYPTLLWTPPYPVKPGEVLTFDLKLVEILSGQTTESALLLNPAYYSGTGLTTTFLPYPISAPAIVDSQLYGWQVKAYINGNPAGETEMWSFVYVVKNIKTLFQNLDASSSFIEMKPEINMVPVTFVDSINFYFKISNSNIIVNLELYHDKDSKKINPDTSKVATKVGDNFFSYSPAHNSNPNHFLKNLFDNIVENEVYFLVFRAPEEQTRYLRFIYIKK